MMESLFDGMTPLFSVPALLGTLVFGVRALMMLIGGDGPMGDADVGGGADAGFHAGHQGSDFAFEVISLQSIAAFLMGAGWGGLGAYKGSELSLPLSIGVALVSGVAMLWLLFWILRSIHELRSSGNISVSDAIGREAQVYVTVPAAGEGQGQIQIVVKERLRTMTAVSDGAELPRQARVRVVRANADNTVVVEPAGDVGGGRS